MLRRAMMAGGAGGGDPHWSNVVSLLHFEGADGSTAFTDQKGRVWTPTGNAQIDTAQFKYGASSVVFDGAGDTITTPSTADIQLASSDFTIEGWVRTGSTSGNSVVIAKHTGSTGEWIIYRSGTTLQFYASSNNAASWDIAGGIAIGTIGAGAWHHVAVTRAGSDFRTFLNGVPGATATSALQIAANSSALRIGGNVATDFFEGWIDDFRLTKGVARYTGAFSPPGAQFPDG